MEVNDKIKQIDSEIEDLDKQIDAIHVKKQKLKSQREQLVEKDIMSLVGMYFINELDKNQIIKVISFIDENTIILAIIVCYNSVNKSCRIEIRTAPASTLDRHFTKISESEALKKVAEYTNKFNEFITHYFYEQ